MGKYKFKKNNGFTLVETLIAIGIFSLAIAGIFTSVKSGLQSSSLSKDRIVAEYLVQDAIEQIKNIRDENNIRTFKGTATNWLYGMLSNSSEPCYFGKKCYIDSYIRSTNPGAASVFQCTIGVSLDCPSIQQHSSGLFGYGIGVVMNPTKYRRTMQFQNVVSDREVVITVTIDWTERGVDKSYQITQSIFNLQ